MQSAVSIAQKKEVKVHRRRRSNSLSQPTSSDLSLDSPKTESLPPRPVSSMGFHHAHSSSTQATGDAENHSDEPTTEGTPRALKSRVLDGQRAESPALHIVPGPPSYSSIPFLQDSTDIEFPSLEHNVPPAPALSGGWLGESTSSNTTTPTTTDSTNNSSSRSPSESLPSPHPHPHPHPTSFVFSPPLSAYAPFTSPFPPFQYASTSGYFHHFQMSTHSHQQPHQAGPSAHFVQAYASATPPPEQTPVAGPPPVVLAAATPVTFYAAPYPPQAPTAAPPQQQSQPQWGFAPQMMAPFEQQQQQAPASVPMNGHGPVPTWTPMPTPAPLHVQAVPAHFAAPHYGVQPQPQRLGAYGPTPAAFLPSTGPFTPTSRHPLGPPGQSFVSAQGLAKAQVAMSRGYMRSDAMALFLATSVAIRAQWPIEYARGNLLEFSTHQQASFWVQQKLRAIASRFTTGEAFKNTPFEWIFVELSASAHHLAYNGFGNFVLQTIYELSEISQRNYVLLRLNRHLYNLCIHKQGCRVVQGLIRHDDPSAHQLIARLILQNIVTFASDEHASHVVQLALTLLQDRQKIVQSFIANLLPIAKGKYGCKSVKHAYDVLKGSDGQSQIVDLIIGNWREVTHDMHANFVFQHIVLQGAPEDSWRLVSLLRRRFAQLVLEPFAAWCCQAALIQGEDSQRIGLLEEFFELDARTIARMPGTKVSGPAFTAAMRAMLVVKWGPRPARRVADLLVRVRAGLRMGGHEEKHARGLLTEVINRMNGIRPPRRGHRASK